MINFLLEKILLISPENVYLVLKELWMMNKEKVLIINSEKLLFQNYLRKILLQQFI